MKKFLEMFLICVFFLTACSGIHSVVKKRYRNQNFSLKIVDLTTQNDEHMDAGVLLHQALEDTLSENGYVITTNGDPTQYQLKYKVVDYEEGNRVLRSLALGSLTKMGKADLTVKAALFKGETMLGNWDVRSWLTDGLMGGSQDVLFEKTAARIADHLRGDY